MLTELQQRIARVIAGLVEAEGFALAGGAALVVHGLSDRPTNDLDYFTTAPPAVAALRSALEAALPDAGLSVEVERDFPTFVRLKVSDTNTYTEVDLAWDARLRPPVATDLGPVLDREELAADKVLALFGRAEARDFVDVHRLSEYFELDRLLALATEKDAGFSPQRLAEAMSRIDRLDRADFDVDDTTYRALRRWTRDTQRTLGVPPPPRRPGPRL